MKGCLLNKVQMNSYVDVGIWSVYRGAKFGRPEGSEVSPRQRKCGESLPKALDLKNDSVLGLSTGSGIRASPAYELVSGLHLGPLG